MTDSVADQQQRRASAIALTWEPPDPGQWEFDGAHQAEPASAALQEVFPLAFKAGFTQAFALYGLPLSHMELRYVNGWAYMSPFVHGAPRKGSGKPPPAIMLKLLTRLPPSARRRIKVAAAAIENDVAMSEIDRWDELRPRWIERNLEFQDVDLSACSDAELADQVWFTNAHFLEGVTLHFALISQVIPVGEYLVRTAEWGIDPKLAGKAAFHGVRSSAEGRRRLAAVADPLGEAIVHDLDHVRLHSETAAKALDDYLRHHGSWILSDDIQSETLAEMPDVVLRTIERNRGWVARRATGDRRRRRCVSLRGAHRAACRVRRPAGEGPAGLRRPRRQLGPVGILAGRPRAAGPDRGGSAVDRSWRAHRSRRRLRPALAERSRRC